MKAKEFSFSAKEILFSIGAHLYSFVHQFIYAAEIFSWSPASGTGESRAAEGAVQVLNPGHNCGELARRFSRFAHLVTRFDAVLCGYVLTDPLLPYTYLKLGEETGCRPGRRQI